MGRSQNKFIKKQKAEKKRKRKAEKIQRRHDKKNQESKGSLEDMIAYVDDEGNIVSKPSESTEDEEQESNDKEESNKNEN